MNSIDQAIRESLLESLLYRESCGEMILPDPKVLNRIYKMDKAHRYRNRPEITGWRTVRFGEYLPAYLLDSKKVLFWIDLNSYLNTIQMQEIQKMRAE